MKKFIMGKKSVAFIVAAMLFTVCTTNPDIINNNTVYAKTILEQYQQEFDKLEKDNAKLKEELKGIQQQIENAQKDAAASAQVKSLIESKINLLNSSIVKNTDKIEALEVILDEKYAQIAEKEIEIAENTKVFEERMRAVYMRKESTVLGLLLGADSFSDFLYKSRYATELAKNDVIAIEKLEKSKAALDDSKIQIESLKDVYNTAKEEFEQQKAEQNVLLQKAADDYAQAKQEELTMKLTEKELIADIKKSQSEMNDVFAKIQASSIKEYIGGEFKWPLPGFIYISSHFGPRTLYGVPNNHTGTDISGSGVMGANIVSAGHGVVAYVQHTYTPHVGYGKYLIIDHGGGVKTLYAHCSAISVSKGQKVSAGQVIGKVGSTGNSTGAHLHFEIRKNNVPVNPMSYFK